MTLQKIGKLLMILQLSISVNSTHGSIENGLPKKCRRLAHKNMESRGKRLGAAAELTRALADFAPSREYGLNMQQWLQRNLASTISWSAPADLRSRRAHADCLAAALCWRIAFPDHSQVCWVLCSPRTATASFCRKPPSLEGNLTLSGT